MPPFSSSLLPLSLKEIGGLGPTKGSCVSRLPTIMTPHHVTRWQRDILQDLCYLCLLPFLLAFVHYYIHKLRVSDKGNVIVF